MRPRGDGGNVFPMARWDGQAERYDVVRVPAFELRPELGWAARRSEGVDVGV